MSVANADELGGVLAAPGALGRCLARHAFGMRCWVELVGRALGRFERPADLAVAARLVGDNARHMLLFRERAIALGADPDAYRAPPAGAAIYERLEGLEEASSMAALALGSLDHFSELLSIYRSVADRGTSAVIDEVRADVDLHRALLGGLVGAGGHALRAEAQRLYRARELVEVKGYRRRAP
jgi:hypothetical protein